MRAVVDEFGHRVDESGVDLGVHARNEFCVHLTRHVGFDVKSEYVCNITFFVVKYKIGSKETLSDLPDFRNREVLRRLLEIHVVSVDQHDKTRFRQKIVRFTEK